MNNATKILLAKIHMGEARTEALADWAVSMLELGFETDHMGMLAGLALECSPDPVEVRHYFALVLEELGWSEPPILELLHEYGLMVAESILSGTVRPIVGCHKMYKLSLDLFRCDDHSDMTDWLYLDDQLDRRTYQELEGKRLEAAIIEAAHSYLSARNANG